MIANSWGIWDNTGMKLLLTSSGFTNQDIVSAFEKLVGKPAKDISIAIINEAYAVEHSDHSWNIAELVRIRETVGGKVEFVNLLANDLAMVRARIELCDAIFVLGGNTDYLMHVYQNTGFDKLLPELLKTKVYVGSSAGSMVICNRISTEAYLKVYGERGDYGITSYLGLIDVAIKPHLNSDHFPNNRKDILLDIAKTYPKTIYALSDNTALVVDENVVHVAGTGYIKIENGIIATH